MWGMLGLRRSWKVEEEVQCDERHKQARSIEPFLKNYWAKFKSLEITGVGRTGLGFGSKRGVADFATVAGRKNSVCGRRENAAGFSAADLPPFLTGRLLTRKLSATRTFSQKAATSTRPNLGPIPEYDRGPTAPGPRIKGHAFSTSSFRRRSGTCGYSGWTERGRAPHDPFTGEP